MRAAWTGVGPAVLLLLKATVLLSRAGHGACARRHRNAAWVSFPCVTSLLRARMYSSFSVFDFPILGAGFLLCPRWRFPRSS